MKRAFKIALPLALLVIGAGIAIVLIKAKPKVAKNEPEAAWPLVRMLEVESTSVTLDVKSQGTVLPRTESTLVAQVSGQVIEVSPAFAVGGFFAKGGVLLRIDPRDYQLAVERARAEEAGQKARVTLEEAQAKIAEEEWAELGRGESSALVRREPQLAQARATLAASRAARRQAELNLERTSLRAPYDGRVREKLVDVGQHVGPGQRLARIYAIDYAEVSLPVSDGDLAFLDLPRGYRSGDSQEAGATVRLTAGFAGRLREWPARIVRTSGEIDPRSRMLNLIARIDEPYGDDSNTDRPPLSVGLFVNAEIRGRSFDDLFVLPRSALRPGNRLLVLDGNRLRFRDVEVLRVSGDLIYVSSGLESGERVCISRLDAITDGMQVRTVRNSEVSPATGAAR